jgi:thiamine transporter
MILVAVFAIGVAVSFLLLNKQKKPKIIARTVSITGLVVSLIGALYLAFNSLNREDRPFLAFNGLVTLSVFVLIALIAGAIVTYCFTNRHKKTSTLVFQCSVMIVALLSFSIILYSASIFTGSRVSLRAMDVAAEHSDVAILIGILLPAVIAGIAVAYLIVTKDKPKVTFSTRDVAYAGVMLAMAISLSYIGVRLPWGGRITLASSLPIMMYCYFFGFQKGFIMVCAFLAFQFIQGPFILNPVQAVMDYVVAYMALLPFAMLNKKVNDKYFTFPVMFFVAASIYVVVRYTSHVIAGFAFFRDTVPEGWDLVPYVFVYNLFFIADAAIALSGAAGLLLSNVFLKHMAIAGGLDSKIPPKTAVTEAVGTEAVGTEATEISDNAVLEADSSLTSDSKSD